MTVLHGGDVVYFRKQRGDRACKVNRLNGERFVVAEDVHGHWDAVELTSLDGSRLHLPKGVKICPKHLKKDEFRTLCRRVIADKTPIQQTRR